MMIDKADNMITAEIDLSALADNFQEIRRITSDSAEIMAVVKADGYGHGAVETAKVALKNGATYLAVARLPEAVELREADISAPILLFGYCPPGCVSYLVENDIRASVNTVDAACCLSDAASQLGVDLIIHVKVDTGMGRLGLVSDRLIDDSHPLENRAADDILKIANLPHLRVEGIYTHFANADSSDKTHSLFQFELFSELLDQLRSQSFEVPIRHAANSAAIIGLPETHLDLVRPGIAQYGLWPSDATDRQLINLKPVMSIKSRIIQVKDVPLGFKVSYGSTYETPCQTRIATVPIGYADGYDRALSSKGSMLVSGSRVPLVGRVCMDLTMLDVGHLDDVQVNDEVVVLGRQGEERITAEEIAALIQTINYEIVSAITARINKVYIA